MTDLVVVGFRHTDRFAKDLRAAPPEVKKAAQEALSRLKTTPRARTLRLHPLHGFGKPTVWKIDVVANHAWQITFEMEASNVAKLCRLATHKKIDLDPRE